MSLPADYARLRDDWIAMTRGLLDVTPRRASDIVEAAYSDLIDRPRLEQQSAVLTALADMTMLGWARESRAPDGELMYAIT